uniref:Uncharacterized protein n=1 Tax=uncultured prokaryote TaxID=198431 RepID=A0A0H5Q3A1_9ZZZZ|nr:hypothetical protein [uncultured prokaryote]
MAGMKFIDDARQRLEDRLLELKMIIETVNAALGEHGESPPWLYLMHKHADGIDTAAHEYMDMVHQHARPVLNDLERLSR